MARQVPDAPVDVVMESLRDDYAGLRAAASDVVAAVFAGQERHHPAELVRAADKLRRVLRDSPMRRSAFPGEAIWAKSSEAASEYPWVMTDPSAGPVVDLVAVMDLPGNWSDATEYDFEGIARSILTKRLVLDPSSSEVRKRLALALDVHATIFVQSSNAGAIYECGCNSDGYLGALVGEDAVSAHIVDRLLAALAPDAVTPGGERCECIAGREHYKSDHAPGGGK